MQSFSSLLHHASRSLAHHLDRLHSTLNELRERLREAVVQAIGQSASGAVRDAVHLVLEGLTAPSLRRQAPSWSRPLHRPAMFAGDDLDLDDQRLEPDSGGWYDEEDIDDEPRQRQQAIQPQGENTSRWRHALAIGCGSVAWSLRREARRFSTLTSIGVGLASAVTAYVLGPGLIASAMSLLALSETMQAGTGVFALSGRF